MRKRAGIDFEKLSEQQQQRLYLAVQKRMEDDRVCIRSPLVVALLWAFTLPERMIRFHGTSLESWAEIEESRKFKRIYYDAKRMLVRMKHNELISVNKTASGMQIGLTKKGKFEKMRLEIINTKNKAPDGKACYVFFDIPESAGSIRDAFRYFLKRAKFSMLQKSVWCSLKDVASKMCVFVKELGAEKWVTVVLGEKI